MRAHTLARAAVHTCTLATLAATPLTWPRQATALAHTHTQHSAGDGKRERKRARARVV